MYWQVTRLKNLSSLFYCMEFDRAHVCSMPCTLIFKVLILMSRLLRCAGDRTRTHIYIVFNSLQILDMGHLRTEIQSGEPFRTTNLLQIHAKSPLIWSRDYIWFGLVYPVDFPLTTRNLVITARKWVVLWVLSRKRVLVKYQSQSAVIKVMFCFSIILKNPLNFGKSNS